MSWFSKWHAFFFPVVNWKFRYGLFRGGKKIWKVPENPSKPVLMPFPLQWVPHSLNEEDFTTKAQHKSGFALIEVRCTDTGVRVAAGEGVSCLRCGVPLHPLAANAFSPMDPPVCKRCSWIILLYK
jgi:hypothetical protein